MRFCYLDKGEKNVWLPRLFDLLYENMRSITPSGRSYGQEKAEWLAEVSPALDKAPRQILLCFADDRLAGYLQYYVRERMLMVEELQLKKEYHRTLLFYKFCKYLLSVLPEDLETVEAYADKRNQNSLNIMRKLGMKPIEEEIAPYPHLVHLSGEAERIKRFLTERQRSRKSQRQAIRTRRRT